MRALERFAEGEPPAVGLELVADAALHQLGVVVVIDVGEEHGPWRGLVVEQLAAEVDALARAGGALRPVRTGHLRIV